MRLQSIDSLRGIAALAVVVFHIWGMKFFVSPTILTALPGYGYSGIFLFFVISGFCIHLRYAKGSDVNFLAFWKRRWIRLYPAYIASLALYIWWKQPAFDAFFWYDLGSHLLMLHNFDLRTVYSINGAAWTLAIEEQLYLLYFLLLPMRHRWGWPVTFVVVFGARGAWLALSLFLHHSGIYDLPFGEGSLSNWGIWTLGALAAEAYVGKIKLPNWCFSLVLALGFLALAAVLDYHRHRVGVVLAPMFWGLGFFVILNRFVRDGISLQWLAGVGLFSYSLYLTHGFVIEHVPAALGIPAALVFSWVFYRIFEKPFMNLGKTPRVSANYAPSES
jgi:peptidoglycan/LPS O-acetylase OafA/YrhL